MIIWCLIIVGAVLLDQISKLLVVRFLDPEAPFVIWEGVFRFSYVENEGAAFGMFSDQRWIFMVISTLAILGMLFYLWRYPPDSRFACVALSMIIGGGIGNMIDRVRLEYVIDFIDFYLFPEIWPWVFNVADSFVCVGGGMLFLWCVISLIQDARKKPIPTEAVIDTESEEKTEEE